MLVIAVPAVASSDRGELTSAFNTEINQFKTDAFAGFDRPDGFITPLGFPPQPQLICDDLVLGTWYTVFDESRSVLTTAAFEVELDGELLDPKRKIRRVRFEGELVWGLTEGVAVIGSLSEGLHTLVYRFDFEGDGVFELAIPTDIDVSPEHC
jgi:hypothetical protein